MTRSEWVEYAWRLAAGFDGTQHTLSNHHVQFTSADEATCLSYLRAMHYFAAPDEESFVTGGHYVHDLLRTPDGWKISAWRYVMTWEQGDPNAFRVALARPPRT
jgi:hypothetical protein